MTPAAPNAFTVDVEDYFHVSAFARVAPAETWDRHESRVVSNTRRILELLARHDVRGTFFVLGWVARRHPHLVREIRAAGHEIGCHSFWHRLVYDLTPDEFRDDARLARDVLEDIIGEPVTAYRAPSFSITGRSLWALDILADEGFTLDASVYPIRHDRYGIPSAPIRPHRIPTKAGPITEFSGSTVRIGGMNLPVGGGGYFRIYPWAATRTLLTRLQSTQRGPFGFYIHPWEVDPDQPRLACRWATRVRHYASLAQTADRLDRLLNSFPFDTMSASLDAIDVPLTDWRRTFADRTEVAAPLETSPAMRATSTARTASRRGAFERPTTVVAESFSPSVVESSTNSSRRRMHVLYITHRVPHPPNRGDRIRTWNILKRIAQHADVSLACLADEPIAPETHDALAKVCRRVEIVPVERRRRWLRAGLSFAAGRTITTGAFESPRLRRAIERLAADAPFDVALGSSSSVAPYLELPALAAARRWVDLIDVDSQKWLDYAASHRGPKSWLYGSEGRRLRAEESRLARTAERLFVVTEAEADLFRAFCPDAPISALPNGVDVDYFQPRTTADDGSLVFVGALDYWPNIDAACWFAKTVWPEIKSRRPDATFRLVGRAPHPDVTQLGAIDGVEVIGTVPDVRPWIERAAVAVVPLRIARGVQNKVLEAMAMGKAVVCSPQPLQGLDAVPGQHLMSAATLEQWTTTVIDLLESPEMRSALGAAARDHILRHHRWETCLAPLQTLLDPRVATRGAAPLGTPAEPAIAP